MNKNGQLKSARLVKSTRNLKTPFLNKNIFVVQFEPSGFVLMSNNRLNFPVLAFSDKDSFEYTEFSHFPDGMKEWLTESVRLNLLIEADTALQRMNNVLQLWDRYSPRLKDAEVIDPFECTDTYVRHVVEIYDDAVTSVRWRQSDPYNACWAPPHRSCDGPVGCGPVAAGQIMFYWKYPTSIDWNNIDESYPYNATEDCNSEIAQLMDLLIDECNVSMDCDYGLVTVNNLVSGLKSLGYSNAKKVDYNFADVRQNVQWGYPVIIKGAPSLFEQHYWVCDGYHLEYDEYEKSCPHPNGPVISYFSANFVDYVHLNWGWGDQNQNIWYFSNQIFQPAGSNDIFSHYAKAIVNIYPDN